MIDIERLFFNSFRLLYSFYFIVKKKRNILFFKISATDSQTSLSYKEFQQKLPGKSIQ